MSSTSATQEVKHESAVVVSALLRGLTAPRSQDLHRNIFLNPNTESSLKHVELTDDSIRLVPHLPFSSSSTTVSQ
jgi:hypothetical protein